MARKAASDRVTLQDVARLSGVSPATASKVLNGRTDVSAATRGRVLAVMADVGYHPTTARRDPGRPDALVAVFERLDSLYTATVLRGMVAATAAAGADLVLRYEPDAIHAPDAAAGRAWIATQQASGAGGIIAITTAVPESVVLAAEEMGVPLVAIDPLDTLDSQIVSVGATNWAGGRSATEHVIGLGHRRIGWIGGPPKSAASIERFHGYQAALDAAGLLLDPALVRGEDFSAETGRRLGGELLDLADPPTAIVSANDEVAVGVLTAARERGVPVPERLSVVGFDDTPQTLWTTPRLTSVRQPLVGMGRMAVESVLTLASGRPLASRHVQLATVLMVRESTGPAPRP